jgi:hypothetical protein
LVRRIVKILLEGAMRLEKLFRIFIRRMGGEGMISHLEGLSEAISLRSWVCEQVIICVDWCMVAEKYSKDHLSIKKSKKRISSLFP